MAFSACARNHQYNRPSLVLQNVLVIEQGRHPLSELVVDTFIPNNTCMGSGGSDSCGIGMEEGGQVDHGGGRVHVITGPNASGKSCYIKQCGLIAYLAHLGAFVPAKSAKVGIVDRIFTRLVSKESLRLQQSTFMIDLTQV